MGDIYAITGFAVFDSFPLAMAADPGSEASKVPREYCGTSAFASRRNSSRDS